MAVRRCCNLLSDLHELLIMQALIASMPTEWSLVSSMWFIVTLILQRTKIVGGSVVAVRTSFSRSG